MQQPLQFAHRVTRDVVIVAAAGGLVGLVFSGLPLAFSIICGALWMAANFLVLAWLLQLAYSGKQVPRLFIFPVVCAKLPASYFLLWWLIRADYLEPLGTAIGICILPPVLVFRGLSLFRTYDTRQGTTEEGR